MKIINKTPNAGYTALNERESKGLLKEYGVPVVKEIFALTEDEVVEAAQKLGFPVVLKGLSSTILHKTEQGLIELNLTESQGLRKAYQSIAKKAGDELEGFVVQPQIAGKRELVAGLFSDAQFGPVIMFGVGGIFTEVLEDVTLRLAPITELEAAQMLREIKGKALLDDFRGEKAVNRESLIQALLALSRISIERKDIAEIDINPLIIKPDGKICAVDALVMMVNKSHANQKLPLLNSDTVRNCFFPKSVAFVGASATRGKWGHLMFTLTVSREFSGDIYLVNPKGGTIANRRVYKSVAEIPGNVDLAVITIPVSKVIELIPQFQEKGIKTVILVTSGFAETGDLGKKLQENLCQQATEANLLLIGPNTMGISTPQINFYCTGSHLWPKAGSVTIVSPSANIATELLEFTMKQDIGVRICCDLGNEGMLTNADVINAFAKDKLTKIFVLYVEGLKNGRRFFEIARNVSQKKPIILLKGGQKAAGRKAALSHTGALASDPKIFDAACRQAGIIKVDQSADLRDLVAAFSSLPLPRGNRIGIMTYVGGQAVLTADICAEYGLEVPELPKPIIERISKLLPPHWSHSNPVDLVGEGDPSLPMLITEELMQWDGCDAVIHIAILGRRILSQYYTDSIKKADPNYDPHAVASLEQKNAEFEQQYILHLVKLMEKYNKPIFGVHLLSDDRTRTVYNVEGSIYKGVSYENSEKAVKACARMLEYQKTLE